MFKPPGDGSCQFATLARQLSGLGMFRSLETMREENYLDNDGFPLVQFIPEFDSWESYLQNMATSNSGAPRARSTTFKKIW